MTPGARVAAAIEILDIVMAGAPAERELTRWARRSRFAGSKDRAAVRDIAFDCLRNLRSFQAAAGGSSSRRAAIGWCLSHGVDQEEIFSGLGHAPEPLSRTEQKELISAIEPSPAIAYDVQDWVWHRLVRDLGPSEAARSASALKARAPLDLRVNVSKNSLEDVKALLAVEGIETQLVDRVPGALRSSQHSTRLSRSKAYTDGLVEIQDAASQAVVGRLPFEGAARVLDFCAGGGGKSLAMAAQHPGLRIDAWDAAPDRFKQLKERAARAGAAVQILRQEPTQDYDLVLLDAPCSGSGAWRRSPDAKWRLTEARLAELRVVQQAILAKGWARVTPGGVLAYATCSIFSEENEIAVQSFQETHSAARLLDQTRLPLGQPGDGFFLALFEKAA